MKKLFILALLSLTLSGAHVDKFAKEMGFERDYKSALVKAKKEKKPLIMVLGSDYCPWCRKFERKTLNSEIIHHKLTNKFVTLVVDNRYDKKLFPQKFQTKITPKVFFINPHNEESLFDTIGYIKKEEFSINLENALKLYTER